MIFVIFCEDKPDGLQIRMNTRPDHVAWLNDLDAEGVLRFAGPFLGDDGKPTGSMVAIEAEDAVAAKKIADADPYAKAGVFESVDIRPFNWVFKNPEAA